MQANDEILLTRDVCQMVRLSSVTLWRMENAKKFPKPDMIIGKLKRGWFRSTITNWISEQASNAKAVA